ncbi:hypothetical protein ABIB40_000679 [Pedobacter sp. UYP30]|uniref:PIN-like domain-containing protein n=1 Tax=Pedobacter sp. UYP30 TaxID=1756400 RepID=UPI003399B791
MKKFKIFIDENLPKQLAIGLNELQRPQNIRDGFELEVLSVSDVYGIGAKDEDWIPKVGAINGIVITQDFRIQTQKHQRELYLKNDVGIFFLNPPSKLGYQYWEMVKKLISEWENIKKIVNKNKPPFAFRCTSKTAFVKMD